MQYLFSEGGIVYHYLCLTLYLFALNKQTILLVDFRSIEIYLPR